MADAWEYSDWIEEADGSSARLTKLRSHIREVANVLRTGSFSIGSVRYDKAFLEDYYESLKKDEKSLSAVVGLGGASGGDVTRSGFTRGRMLT